MMMIRESFGRLAGSLKSKLRSKKEKNHYDKVVKTESMRVEIRSRRAQKLIAETLKAVGSPGRSKSYAF